MINTQKTYDQVLIKNIKTSPSAEVSVCLHHEQLVYEAIKIMSAHSYKVLPVYKEGKCMGSVCINELNRFIRTGTEHQLLYHKLNFDLGSVLHVLNRT